MSVKNLIKGNKAKLNNKKVNYQMLVMVVVFVVAGAIYLGRSDAATSIYDLPRIPWEGGSSYYSVANGPQFAKADAAGWDDPSFFPISVFFSKGSPEHAASLKDAGINTYQVMEHAPEIWPVNTVTDMGMFVMAQVNEWTPEEIGDNTNVVSWFISDECEMGYSGCITDWSLGSSAEQEYTALAVQESYVSQAQSYNDGRFAHANFGNGILRTFWAPNTMDDHIQLMDTSSADKYTYTSPSVRGLFDDQNTGHNSPDWPDGVPIDRAYAYGWQVDQMKRFQDPNNLTPTWGFHETAMPYLFGEEDITQSITMPQLEGAVWSALIHEARGIGYFQHNNSPVGCTANYSIVECPEVHAGVKAINEKVLSLAPVLNTQSYYNSTRVVNGHTYYEYDFGNDTDTMLKTYNGDAYIFAGLGMECNDEACSSGYAHATGNKTFEVPYGVNGDVVEVVGENRTISVVNGQFTDNFAEEYTHHVYKVAVDGSGGTTDNENPTVSITNPGNASTVSDTVNITANATDNIAVDRVEFLVDGAVIATDNTSPYSATWDTTSLSNTSYVITATAYDVAGNSATSSNVTVTVNNTSGSVDYDLNDDGQIDISDLSILLANYGTNDANADINNNGIVDITDLSILLTHYGETVGVVDANFSISNGVIYDPEGNEFVPIGANVNGPYSWWVSPTAGYADIAKTRWNWSAVRVNSCLPGGCPGAGGYSWDTNNDIDAIVNDYTSQNIAVILELHQYTGNIPSGADLTAATNFWIDKAIRYKDNPYVWFNIFNEPGSEPLINEWYSAHDTIITAIRNEGANNMIVADASNWGQDFNGGWDCPSGYTSQYANQSAVLTRGQELMNKHDNVSFSIHIYGWWGGSSCPADTRDKYVDDYFNLAKQQGLAVMVGEIQGITNRANEPWYQAGQTDSALAFFRRAPVHRYGMQYWHGNTGSSPTSGLLNDDSDWFNINSDASNLSEWGVLLRDYANLVNN